MTNLQKEAVKTAIVAYCKIKAISATTLATKAGVSAATISNMKNGAWVSIDDRMWRKVWNIVNPEVLAGIYQTTDCKSIFTACEDAISNRRMVGITGDTGMGKSTGCKAFAMRPNVFYVYIDKTVTPRVFLEGLLVDVGAPFTGSLNAMMSKLAAELNTLAHPLLLVDECGKLTDQMILCLHSLRDMTMGNCGMVLAGMPDFRNRLIRNVNKGTTGYAEFYRRINMWHELKGLTKDEITHVLEKHGITDKELQAEYRRLTRFGDLMNEISLHNTVNP